MNNIYVFDLDDTLVIHQNGEVRYENMRPDKSLKDLLKKLGKDNKYIYIVNPTVVDDDIRELSNLCNAKYFNKERAIELLHSLEDNNIYGWVVIRAKKIIGNDIQLL